MQATLRDQLDKVVVRESATVLRIELPQLLAYGLEMAETITTSVPAACVRSGAQLRAEHIGGVPFRMLPPAGRAFVGGTLLQRAQETTVKTEATQLTVVLKQDTFLSDEAGAWPRLHPPRLASHPCHHHSARACDPILLV